MLWKYSLNKYAFKELGKNTAVKVTLTKGGKLTVYESDGKTPFTVITDKDNGIQNTNNNYLVPYADFMLNFSKNKNREEIAFLHYF